MIVVKFDQTELEAQLAVASRAGLALAYCCAGCDASKMLEYYEIGNTGGVYTYGVRLKPFKGEHHAVGTR